MSDVIEELSSEGGAIGHAHVVQRIADWKLRVSSLYDQVCLWLPSYVSADRRGVMSMHEEMMNKHGVQEVDIPILNLFDEGDWIAKIVPRGLWIIGANGRLDLFTKQGQAIIVDRAENFALPNWQIASADNRRDTQALTAEALLKALDL